MKQDEVESQVSAMFDGELPAAECELLSRRIDRDDNLRTRWSRYAVIGAAMRFEPVATARRNFAARVSSALEQAEGQAGARTVATTPSSAARAARIGWRSRALWWQAALAAGMVGAVAGLSITLLRNATLDTTAAGKIAVASAGDTAGGQAVRAGLSVPATGTRGTVAAARLAAVHSPAVPAAPGPVAGAVGAAPGHEPWSYVTPPSDGTANTPLRTELVDYIVAHSEYSTPLMRPDLLSELISGEDGVDSASPVAGADSGPPGAGAPVDAGADGIDATSSSASASGR
ncbi:MAG: RseA family anti-sigma factor [Steroidobacteraceae bacterium]